MSVDVKYRTSATATGGRDGQASTADGSLSVKLSLPKELGGVQVLVNDTPAPLMMVRPGQIKFQVPSATPMGSAADAWGADLYCAAAVCRIERVQRCC